MTFRRGFFGAPSLEEEIIIASADRREPGKILAFSTLLDAIFLEILMLHFATIKAREACFCDSPTI